jgi:very-short-patch-repair endonuclease
MHLGVRKPPRNRLLIPPVRRLRRDMHGATHEDQRRDRMRDRHLERLGFRVLRFWNDDVYQNLDGVVERIWSALQEP